MAQKGKAYYYVTNATPRKWIPLGNDLHQARLKWAELEREPIDTQDKTFAVIAERYRREVLNQKAQRTQRDYREALEAWSASSDISRLTPSPRRTCANT